MGLQKTNRSRRLRNWFLTAAGLLLMAGTAFSIRAAAAPKGTDVGGGITTDTTWTLAGSPYIVVTNVLVSPNATLTIQPGVEVRFNHDTRLRIEGKLFAQGNPANMIRFTANNSNNYPGYWKGIFFKDTGEAKTQTELIEQGLGNFLQYCIIENAGLQDGAVLIDDSAVLVDHCIVRNNSSSGIRVESNSGYAVGITNNTVSYNRVSGHGGGILGIESSITDNVVMNNFSTGDGGGIYAVSSTVRDNIVGYNVALNEGGGIYSTNSFVSENFVHDNSGDEAGGIYSLNNTALTQNTIVRNQSVRVAAGLYFIGSNLFQQNTVVANKSAAGFAYGGVVLSGSPTVSFNNFYANQPFDFVVQSATNVNGENNFWGTTDSGVILGRVFDAFDDPVRGLFDFSPFLLDATSPIPPPLNLQGSFTGNSVDLTWSPIPATSTTYKYKVYYDTDNAAPPYNGSGLPEGNSPIDVGSATNLTLTGLNGRISVVVTAYDEELASLESWYSNRVDNLARVYLPIVE